MSEPHSRVVLSETVTRDAIDDAMHRCGWQLTNVVPPTGIHPGQLIFAVPQPETILYLVQDGRLGVVYVAALGQGAEALLAQVRFELPCCDVDSWGDLTDDPSDLDRFRRGMAILALASPGPTAERVDCAVQALAHADSRVRTAALTAVSYAPWPELRPALEAVRDHDSVEELRSGASQLLDKMTS
jgi:hypothetical protein